MTVGTADGLTLFVDAAPPLGGKARDAVRVALEAADTLRPARRLQIRDTLGLFVEIGGNVYLGVFAID